MPRVSVIIPTYNRKDLVQLTIDSALAQTFTDSEIIVVDDGSTDNTGEALRTHYGLRICYEYQANQGESAARNRALQLAQGEFIALLDSDDLWLPAKLEKEVARLDADPHAGMVFCEAWLIDAEGERIADQPEGAGLTPDDLALEKMVFVNQIGGPSTTLIRRSTLDRVGGFDGQIRFGEDWDVWLQMLVRRDPIAFIPEPLTCIRRHRGTQCYYPNAKRNTQRRNEHLRLLNKAFDQWPGPIPAGLRERALARQYAEAALNELAVNHETSAHENLQQAVQLTPDVVKVAAFEQTIIDLTAVIAEERETGSYERAENFMQRAIALRQAAISEKSPADRQLAANAAATIGFVARSRDDWQAARHYLWQAMRYDASWIKNRGARSTLIRLLGKVN
jgi:glycosyltransferase involved in cell wall biosynthesis